MPCLGPTRPLGAKGANPSQCQERLKIESFVRHLKRLSPIWARFRTEWFGAGLTYLEICTEITRSRDAPFWRPAHFLCRDLSPDIARTGHSIVLGNRLTITCLVHATMGRSSAARSRARRTSELPGHGKTSPLLRAGHCLGLCSEIRPDGAL